jgi:hypothetical protein
VDTAHHALGGPVFVDRPLGAWVHGRWSIFGANVSVGPPARGLSSQNSRLAPEDIQRNAAQSIAISIGVDGFTSFIPSPSFVRQRTTVIAVEDGDAAGVVWGEANDSASTWLLGVPRIRYSRFDGKRWSAPELVAEASSIKWGNGVAAVIATHGETVIAAPPRQDKSASMLVARRTFTGWSVDGLAVEDANGTAAVALSGTSGGFALFHVDHPRRSSTYCVRSTIHPWRMAGCASGCGISAGACLQLAARHHNIRRHDPSILDYT